MSHDAFADLEARYHEELVERATDGRFEDETNPITIRMSPHFRDELDRVAKHCDVSRQRLCLDLLRTGCDQMVRAICAAEHDDQAREQLALHLVAGRA